MQSLSKRVSHFWLPASRPEHSVAPLDHFISDDIRTVQLDRTGHRNKAQEVWEGKEKRLLTLNRSQDNRIMPTPRSGGGMSR